MLPIDDDCKEHCQTKFLLMLMGKILNATVPDSNKTEIKYLKAIQVIRSPSHNFSFQ
jgi:hypothetical protein